MGGPQESVGPRVLPHPSLVMSGSFSPNQNPEQIARDAIDAQLGAAGVDGQSNTAAPSVLIEGKSDAVADSRTQGSASPAAGSIAL